MKRRDFIKAFAGATVWPSFWGEKRKRPLIGFLSSRSRDDSTHILTAFRQGLAEAGYIAGRDVSIEYRWAGGDYDRLPALAADIVDRGPSVLIAAGGEPSALAAKAASDRIPIVFSVGGDPVKTGLVNSLNRPGGNMTGISLLATELEAKRMGLLHEMAPRAKVIGVLVDDDFQESRMQMREIELAARGLCCSVVIAGAGSDLELTEGFERLRIAGADALLVCAAPFFDTRRRTIVANEVQQNIPAIYQFRDYAAEGGLMSYGIYPPEGYRQIGLYAGFILNGRPPSELPVVRPATFELVINLSTAAATGIDVPPSLLACADEVIS
ncbi:putative ABC transport system substrate-binding protein [Bradyrhizobium sp. LA6.1]|uniref:ABC transporter substrate-binding protein n=1 Tax=Bradyrhizobium sp. LA6.1 TaxID=3156378 RepID=UPI003397F5A7